MKGYALLQTAEKACHAKDWQLALDSYAAAFREGLLAVWANGSPTGAHAKALWLLQKANTGLDVTAERTEWFVKKCAPGSEVDPRVHLETARVHLARRDERAAAAAVAAFLERVPLFLKAVAAGKSVLR